MSKFLQFAFLVLFLALLASCNLRGSKLRAVFSAYLQSQVTSGQEVEIDSCSLLNLEYLASDSFMQAKFATLGEMAGKLSQDIDLLAQIPDSGLGISRFQTSLAKRKIRQQEYSQAFSQRVLHKGEVNIYAIYYQIDSLRAALPPADLPSRRIADRAYDQAGAIIGQYGKIRAHYNQQFIDEVSQYAYHRSYHDDREVPYLVIYHTPNSPPQRIILHFDRKEHTVLRHCCQR
ncbi:MAG: hypothetical protein H6581_13225 [Bacteroidia bacterium]|nr:hypothetical protein [Bacteroidia bacterium]